MSDVFKFILETALLKRRQIVYWIFVKFFDGLRIMRNNSLREQSLMLDKNIINKITLKYEL